MGDYGPFPRKPSSPCLCDKTDICCSLIRALCIRGVPTHKMTQNYHSLDAVSILMYNSTNAKRSVIGEVFVKAMTFKTFFIMTLK